MKKALTVSLIVVLAITLTSIALAADKGSVELQAKQGQIVAKTPPGQKLINQSGAVKSNFSMMLGTVSEIDAADPLNIKLKVQNERDNQIHTVEVTPTTNVTKSTEISELKVGDTIRVMARKVNDKEVAVGIMFGKLRSIPTPKPLPAQASPAPKTPPAAIKETPKK